MRRGGRRGGEGRGRGRERGREGGREGIVKIVVWSQCVTLCPRREYRQLAANFEYN